MSNFSPKTRAFVCGGVRGGGVRSSFGYFSHFLPRALLTLWPLSLSGHCPSSICDTCVVGYPAARPFWKTREALSSQPSRPTLPRDSSAGVFLGARIHSALTIHIAIELLSELCISAPYFSSGAHQSMGDQATSHVLGIAAWVFPNSATLPCCLCFLVSYKAQQAAPRSFPHVNTSALSKFAHLTSMKPSAFAYSYLYIYIHIGLSFFCFIYFILFLM